MTLEIFNHTAMMSGEEALFLLVTVSALLFYTYMIVKIVDVFIMHDDY